LETRQAVRVFSIIRWDLQLEKSQRPQSSNTKDGRWLYITWYKYLADKTEDRPKSMVQVGKKTRLSVLVKVDNVVRNLNGKVDFAVLYEGDKNGMGTNLVAVEAKRQGDTRKGISQCLCYMCMSSLTPEKDIG
jgi:hypothetical protein